MTALNFPDSPSNGDTYQGYAYNGTKRHLGETTEQDARTAVYANIAALPTSGTAGDMAYVPQIVSISGLGLDGTILH